jgi:hypothetical protein
MEPRFCFFVMVEEFRSESKGKAILVCRRFNCELDKLDEGINYLLGHRILKVTQGNSIWVCQIDGSIFSANPETHSDGFSTGQELLRKAAVKVTLSGKKKPEIQFLEVPTFCWICPENRTVPTLQSLCSNRRRNLRTDFEDRPEGEEYLTVPGSAQPVIQVTIKGTGMDRLLTVRSQDNVILSDSSARHAHMRVYAETTFSPFSFTGLNKQESTDFLSCDYWKGVPEEIAKALSSYILSSK